MLTRLLNVLYGCRNLWKCQTWQRHFFINTVCTFICFPNGTQELGPTVQLPSVGAPHKKICSIACSFLISVCALFKDQFSNWMILQLPQSIAAYQATLQAELCIVPIFLEDWLLNGMATHGDNSQRRDYQSDTFVFCLELIDDP